MINLHLQILPTPRSCVYFQGGVDAWSTSCVRSHQLLNTNIQHFGPFKLLPTQFSSPIRFSSTITNLLEDSVKDAIEKIPQTSKLSTKEKIRRAALENVQFHKRQTQKKEEKSQKGKGANSSEPTISKNQQFKQTPILREVLKYIQDQKLGIVRMNPNKEQLHKDLLEKIKLKGTLTAKERWLRRHVLGRRHRSRKQQMVIPMSKFSYGKNFKFQVAASSVESFPKESLPEVAFFGRSNVGKSSVVNSLTNSAKAQVSKTPGFTQTINWFTLGTHISLVDLPGYGFAFANETKTSVWIHLIREYLRTRKSLKRVFLLLDARHGIKGNDKDTIKLLEELKISYQLVLTKSDLVVQEDLARRVYLIQKEMADKQHVIRRILMISAVTRAGMGDLHTEIGRLANNAVPKDPTPPKKFTKSKPKDPDSKAKSPKQKSKKGTKSK